jgi:hypothetical protein
MWTQRQVGPRNPLCHGVGVHTQLLAAEDMIERHQQPLAGTWREPGGDGGEERRRVHIGLPEQPHTVVVTAQWTGNLFLELVHGGAGIPARRPHEGGQRRCGHALVALHGKRQCRVHIFGHSGLVNVAPGRHGRAAAIAVGCPRDPHPVHTVVSRRRGLRDRCKDLPFPGARPAHFFERVPAGVLRTCRLLYGIEPAPAVPKRSLGWAHLEVALRPPLSADQRSATLGKGRGGKKQCSAGSRGVMQVVDHRDGVRRIEHGIDRTLLRATMKIVLQDNQRINIVCVQLFECVLERRRIHQR